MIRSTSRRLWGGSVALVAAPRPGVAMDRWSEAYSAGQTHLDRRSYQPLQLITMVNNLTMVGHHGVDPNFGTPMLSASQSSNTLGTKVSLPDHVDRVLANS